MPRFLLELRAALDADPEAVLAYSHMRSFGDPRRERRHEINASPPGCQTNALDRVISLLRVREAGPIYGLMRTEVLQRSRGFVYPMGFAADTGLTLELAALGRMVCVPKVLM